MRPLGVHHFNNLDGVDGVTPRRLVVEPSGSDMALL